MLRTTVNSLKKKKADAKDAKKKMEIKEFNKLKIKASTPIETHPLYMTIPEAMRYLRAFEVGKSSYDTTLTLQATIVASKGVLPLQGSLALPHPLKETKIALFTTDPEKAEEAKRLGCSVVGGLELIQAVKDGKALDAQQAFATPEIAQQLNQIARVLGPKGLMPSAKKGTVISDIAVAIGSAKGSMPFKQKEHYLCFPIANCSFSDKQVLENITCASAAIRELTEKTASNKTCVLNKVILSSKSGPGIAINF
ncbi:hypothetical protein BABINDRAFT_179120 [Babjeviella inositovora NRRL Y-12698]|uniref:Ribosomal protein n=1 Tax=Babjeviella inositovora NRRL Y-12698 TaxID=984486 RepID=A0A1E3QZS8_9ASCO|nr:uncharacterized protein BABINDRAFT_179120 [Babjeviella inositovora NRRL Y-12698]ODQ83156.1 hypothetical protein BABINDRAFT_179120 [Babjeviella inositovora NRRL Y-12698]